MEFNSCKLHPAADRVTRKQMRQARQHLQRASLQVDSKRRRWRRKKGEERQLKRQREKREINRRKTKPKKDAIVIECEFLSKLNFEIVTRNFVVFPVVFFRGKILSLFDRNLLPRKRIPQRQKVKGKLLWLLDSSLRDKFVFTFHNWRVNFVKEKSHADCFDAFEHDQRLC